MISINSALRSIYLGILLLNATPSLAADSFSLIRAEIPDWEKQQMVGSLAFTEFDAAFAAAAEFDQTNRPDFQALNGEYSGEVYFYEQTDASCPLRISFDITGEEPLEGKVHASYRCKTHGSEGIFGPSLQTFLRVSKNGRSQLLFQDGGKSYQLVFVDGYSKVLGNVYKGSRAKGPKTLLGSFLLKRS